MNESRSLPGAFPTIKSLRLSHVSDFNFIIYEFSVCLMIRSMTLQILYAI